MEGDLPEGKLSKKVLEIPEHDHRKHCALQNEQVHRAVRTVRFAYWMLCLGLIYHTTAKQSRYRKSNLM